MWASDCVSFLSFLCPTQSPQSSVLCSVPSWKFLFSGTRGAGPSVLGRSHAARPHNGRAVMLYQHLFPSSPSLFVCGFNRVPLGQPAMWRARLCIVIFCWFCAADQSLPWLTLNLHLVVDKLYFSPHYKLAAESSRFNVWLTQACIVETKIRYLTPSRIASCTFCAYTLNLLCEQQVVVFRQIYFTARILPVWAEGASHFCNQN